MLWDKPIQFLKDAFTAGDDPIKKEILERTARDLTGSRWSDPDSADPLPEDKVPALSAPRPSEAAPS